MAIARRARGHKAESRRERWSPEPGHLMRGALGDDGRRRATGPEADGGQAPAKDGRPGAVCETADGSRAPIPNRRLPEHAGTASEGEHRHELDML